MPERVLVTGATSLIGQHVVDRLLARGDDVRTLQRRPRAASAGVDHRAGDVSDPDAVASAIGGAMYLIHP